MIPGYTLEWMMKARYRCFRSPARDWFVLAFKDVKPGSAIKVLYGGTDETVMVNSMFRHARLHVIDLNEELPTYTVRERPSTPKREDWDEAENPAVGINGDV